MIDYKITISQNNKKICTLGGSHMNYDNVIWWQLENLLKVVEQHYVSKEQFLSQVKLEAEYFEELTLDEEAPIIDLNKKTIDVPFIQLYDLNTFSSDEYGVSLRKENKKTFAVYEDGEEYELKDVQFNNVDLLKMETVTFDEFKDIAFLMNNLVDFGDNEYIINKKYILRLNLG